MEIIEKRKRDQMDDPPHERWSSEALPADVGKLLDEKETQINITLNQVRSSEISGEELGRRMKELEARRLGTVEIRTQVKEAATQRNTPQQLLSVVGFLFDMKATILNGEKVAGPNSVFCRVPFS